MNLEYYIARRLFQKKNIKNKHSSTIVSIATFAIAISIAVMIITVSVVIGFKNEITQKVIGFGSHLQIVNFDSNTSLETAPIIENQKWLPKLKNMKNIVSVNRYIQKAGIVKTDKNVVGIAFKGIDNDYDWTFFKKYLIEGQVLEITDSLRTNNILISKQIANSLGLKIGDNFRSYFVQDPPRMRNFIVSGIYNTDLEELDKIFVFVDIKHLRKINNWKEGEITGFDININNFSNLTKAEIDVVRLVSNNITANDGSMLKIRNIKEDYPAIFDWLALLDLNVWVILILMIIVAVINMISGILVIILERINMIGILKSLGAKNFSIKKIFMYFSFFLISKGILWGNIIGIGICLLQHFTGLIKIDPASYYVNTIPTDLNILYIILINGGSFVLISIVMFLPIFIISKINTIDTINFN